MLLLAKTKIKKKTSILDSQSKFMNPGSSFDKQIYCPIYDDFLIVLGLKLNVT